MFDAHGLKTAVVSGLAAETVYTVSLVAVNSRGKSVETAFSFRTAVWPFAFQTPQTVTDATGTNATASVKILRADAAGSLALVANGTTVATWPSVAAGETFSASFSVPTGRTRDYEFVVVDPDGLYETRVAGSVFGRRTLGWFDVAFDAAGRSGWTLADGTDPVDGGTWTVSGADNESAFSAGADRRIDLATGEDGFVRYAPLQPTAAGCKARLSGRTELVAEYGAPAAPETAPLAALALGRDGTVVSLYGWTADGWIPLSGAKIASPCTLDWTADFDFVAGTVVYSAGDPPVALSSGGVTNFPLGAAKTAVSRVTYVGNGTVDDFRGVYYVEEPPVDTLVAFDAAIKPGSAGLSFSNAGTDTEHFTISLAGATPGRWYAAFATDELTSDPSAWTCVSCVRANEDGAELSASSVDELGIPIPSQFFKIYGAPDAIPLGTPLSSLLDPK